MIDLINREAAIAALIASEHLKAGSAGHVAAAILRALPPAQEAAPAGEQVADLVRGVWACCEAAEDEAHAKLAADLSDHERGYFTGQRVTAKRIRRATDMPPDHSGDANKMVPPSDMGNPMSGGPVTLTYRNWRGEVAERTIIPRRVWFGSTDWHPEPQWLLTAWDAEKGADRDFALKDFGQPAAPAVKVKPPIPAEGHDIREMIANLSAHPEWPAMRNAGDVKLYFINEGDAHAIRFAALEGGAV